MLSAVLCCWLCCLLCCTDYRPLLDVQDGAEGTASPESLRFDTSLLRFATAMASHGVHLADPTFFCWYAQSPRLHHLLARKEHRQDLGPVLACCVYYMSVAGLQARGLTFDKAQALLDEVVGAGGAAPGSTGALLNGGSVGGAGGAGDSVRKALMLVLTSPGGTGSMPELHNLFSKASLEQLLGHHSMWTPHLPKQDLGTVLCALATNKVGQYYIDSRCH